MPDEVEQRTASDGYPLTCRHALPEGAPRGWLVMLHGIQSHSGWYDFTREGLAKVGWDVCFPDRRGSGRNERERGHAPHWQRLINDAVHFLNDARRERDRIRPEAPVILGGLSWGGKLAYAVARLRPELIDGLVLLYPGIVSRIGPSSWQRIQLALAKALVIQDRKVPVPLDDPALFTSAPQWQEFIRSDPLALREVTTGLLFASRDLDALCRRDPPDTQRSCRSEVRCPPVLLMLAGGDRIIDNDKVTELLVHQVGDALEVFTYPSAAHTLEFEPCRDEYLADLKTWLSHRRSLACDGHRVSPSG